MLCSICNSAYCEEDCLDDISGVRKMNREFMIDLMDRLVHPIVVLPPGYFIPNFKPMGINVWRRLYGKGKIPRPLTKLKGYEAKIAELCECGHDDDSHDVCRSTACFSCDCPELRIKKATPQNARRSRLSDYGVYRSNGTLKAHSELSYDEETGDQAIHIAPFTVLSDGTDGVAEKWWVFYTPGVRYLPLFLVLIFMGCPTARARFRTGYTEASTRLDKLKRVENNKHAGDIEPWWGGVFWAVRNRLENWQKEDRLISERAKLDKMIEEARKERLDVSEIYPKQESPQEQAEK